MSYEKYGDPEDFGPMTSTTKSVCVLILAYNDFDQATGLKAQVAEQTWENKTIRIIDNGSIKPIEGALRIDENIRYTCGMELGWKAMKEKNSDAFWFLNSNIVLPRTDILSELMDHLFQEDDIAQVSPRIMGSDHGFMQWDAVRDMEWMEFSAILVRSATLDAVGFWETELSYGNVTDIEYCYRLKKSGLRSILVGDVLVLKTCSRWENLLDTQERKDFAQAAIVEANLIMLSKYGPDWRGLMAESFGNEDSFVRTILNFPGSTEQS